MKMKAYKLFRVLKRKCGLDDGWNENNEKWKVEVEFGY